MDASPRQDSFGNAVASRPAECHALACMEATFGLSFHAGLLWLGEQNTAPCRAVLEMFEKSEGCDGVSRECLSAGKIKGAAIDGTVAAAIYPETLSLFG